MRFGYFISNARGDAAESDAQVLHDMIEQIECAEAAGFHIIWFPERHFNRSVMSPHPLISIVDAARRTSRVRLGTSVLIAPYRHPLILAEEIGLVDQLTGGRLEIGFARGATVFEYERFGIDDKAAAGRLQETMDILLGLWRTEGDFSFEGEHFSFGDTTATPRPLQRPFPPMSLAARSPESLRYCLKNGLAIHTTPLRQPKSAARTTIETIRAIVEEFPGLPWPQVAVETETFVSEDPMVVTNAMRHLEALHVMTQNFGKHGRIPAGGFGSREPLPQGLEISAGQLAERCVTGNPQSVLQQVRDYRDMGMQEFIANMDFGQSQRDILRSIELFGAHVISQDWSSADAGPVQQADSAATAERRNRLRRECETRFGADWQSRGESEWVAWFERRRQGDAPAPVEIFDVSLNASNIRAEATGIVPPSGKLCVLRDLPCPQCGRPTLVLCHRPNEEPPQELRAIAAASPQWAEWHHRHP